jgi:putative transposase
MRRFDCDTADWHVFARGARRLELIRDNQDCSQFLVFLSAALKKSGCALWAFALMTNHYHLVLRGDSAQLTACMRRLNTHYSRYHNRRYGLEGHAFDGPYQAFRQATPLLTLRCIAYVFYNPVKAGLCVAPEDYPWTCCRCFLGLPGSPFTVDPTPILKSVHADPKIAWKRFHQAMECEARRPTRHVAGKLTMVEVHSQQFEWLLEYAQEHARDLAGEDPKAVAMYWARKCGIAPRAMARALALPNSASIRQTVHRLSQRIAADPKLRSLLDPP